jgi:hypothetical protein
MEDPEQKKKETEAVHEPQGAPEPKAEEPKKKRPYVKPSFQHERVFETSALACGKVGVTQETCRNNRKAS